MVGVYTSIAEKDISEAEPLDGSPVQNEAQLSHHLIDLYMQAKGNCTGRDQEEKLSGLLVQYQDVFSKGANDMGRTSLVKHIYIRESLKEGARDCGKAPDVMSVFSNLRARYGLTKIYWWITEF